LSAIPRGSAFTPFRVRSFRFQWPADLCASFAFEMELIILGWYVLTETQSVFMLALYASMHHIGTLLGPMFGVLGDRVGQHNLLTSMRAFYVLTSGSLMFFAFSGQLNPVVVLVIAALQGMVRPSDIGTRNAVISEIMPPQQLMSAAGIQRTTQDMARIVGALTGAGVVAAMGMGPAYVAICTLYCCSVFLTLQAGRARTFALKNKAKVKRASPWQELKAGAIYVWNTPHIRAVMILALILNGTVFPLYSHMLPYVVKDVYRADQTTLGYLVACGAFGALVGSVTVSRFSGSLSPARLMIYATFSWYLTMLIFAYVTSPAWGVFVLFFAGASQAAGLVPMTTILLRNSAPDYRGRVMGIRMLMIYSNMPGIQLFAPIVTSLGYSLTATLYCLLGLAVALLITLRWRDHLWSRAALTNAR